jgi:hypothetical protein
MEALDEETSEILNGIKEMFFMSQVELTTLGKSCEFFNGKAHEKSIDENGKYIVVNSKFIYPKANHSNAPTSKCSLYIKATL